MKNYITRSIERGKNIFAVDGAAYHEMVTGRAYP